ncbi:hypothetical protein JYU34_003587 [Plutella xylostella]|uniref:Uncharacterized protein n=1 Tax=Plutella xylostella TaxID=51655 RepID=A0ABQ7R0G5_PLUXY|nr:hypothetical protein JYU34_003587 [Plutella xylostella]
MFKYNCKGVSTLRSRCGPAPVPQPPPHGPASGACDTKQRIYKSTSKTSVTNNPNGEPTLLFRRISSNIPSMLASPETAPAQVSRRKRLKHEGETEEGGIKRGNIRNQRGDTFQVTLA